MSNREKAIKILEKLIEMRNIQPPLLVDAARALGYSNTGPEATLARAACYATDGFPNSEYNYEAALSHLRSKLPRNDKFFK